MRQEKTKRLLRERFHLTSKVFKTANALKKLAHYNAIFVGSDQLWNPTLVHDPYNNPYLGLTLPDDQKLVAYAISFGITELPEELIPLYKKGFKKFDGVSIRESSGAELYAKLTGEEKPQQVVDPTLLLPKAFWQNEIKGREVTGAPYILYYWLGPITQTQIEWCERLAQREGKRVIMLAGELLNDDVVDSIKAPLEIRFDADPLDLLHFAPAQTRW